MSFTLHQKGMGHDGFVVPQSPTSRDRLRQRGSRSSLGSPDKSRGGVQTAPAVPGSLLSLPSSPQRYDKLRAGASPHGHGAQFPSISTRQRPMTSLETRLAPGSRQQASRSSTLRQSWPGPDKSARKRPPWVDSTMRSWSDESQLDESFRAIKAQHGSALMERLEFITAQHRIMNDRKYAGSPLVVCVLDQFASSGRLLNTEAGQDIAFAIQVKYSFAGTLGEGGGDLHKWVDDKGGFTCTLTGPVVVRADVVYQGAGVYVFMYKATVAGKYMVSVQLGNGDIPGSPFESIVEAGATEVNSCTVSGLGLLCAEAGHESQFQITARDRFGNRKSRGGEAWDVTLTGPISFNALVHDVGDGTYICKYTSVMCGEFYVSVKSNTWQLPGCPFVLSVVAGRTHGPSCTAVGSCLVSAFAGHDAEFIIEARDIIGNQRVIGDDAFQVEVEGPSLPQISVFDRDDGTYLVTYHVTKIGTYFARVSLGGFPIAGSPFTVTFRPGSVMAVRCTAVGRGITRSYAGEDAKFTIESRDAHFNKTASGKQPFVVSIRGKIAPPVHCIEGEDGEYHYSYRTAKAGVYFVGVLLDSVDIGGSPFKLTVDPGPAHANGCSATGPGITGGYTGIETSLTIYSRDYYGNQRTSGGDIFNVEIGGTAAADMRMRDNENGTYTVAYTPAVGGDYFISVVIGGVHIHGSPFTVSSDPMPRESYLEVYRSLEPSFKENMEKLLTGSGVGAAKGQGAAAKKKTKKFGGSSSWVLNIKLLGAKDLAARDTTVSGDYGTGLVQTSDPYVVFKVGKSTARSSTILKNLEPEWNEELELVVEDRMNHLQVEVMDEDLQDDDDSMGMATVSLTNLVLDKPKLVTCHLRELDSMGNDTGMGQGHLTFVLTFINAPGNFDTRALR